MSLMTPITPTPIEGFPRRDRPYGNVQPFTYRDGATYLEVLEGMRSWLRHTFVPHIDSEMSEIVTSWDAQIEAFVAAVNAEIAANAEIVNEQVDQWTSTTIANNDAITNALLQLTTSETFSTLSEFVSTSSNVRKRMDIFEGFDISGATMQSWDATTYAKWIAGIDARLAGKATKTQIGVGSNGDPIWCYTAGATAAPHAVIVSGTHGIESLPQFAAMRFFSEFTDDPAMRGLRDRLRLSWIPTLNPSGYMTSRYNSSNVDIARNFDYYWSLWSSQTETHPKGAAAMSTTEAQAMKTLLDTTKIACVIDFHTSDAGGTLIAWDSPAMHMVSNRTLAPNAASRWDQSYNAGGGATHREYGMHTQPFPQLINWANKYMVFDKNRLNAAAMLIEANVDFMGSISLSRMTREASRLLCGFLHSYLMEWIENGQTAVQPSPRMAYANRAVTDYTKEIADGGTKIAKNAPAPLRFDGLPTMLGGAQNRHFLDFAVPAPGQVEFEAVIALKSDAANTDSAEVAAAFGLGDVPVAGGNVLREGFTIGNAQIVKTSQAGGDRTTLVIRTRINYTVAKMIRVQLYLNLNTTETRPVEVQRASVFVRYFPNFGAEQVALMPSVS